MTRASSPKYTTGTAHRREWLDNGAVHARRAFGQDLSDSFVFAVTKHLVPTCSGLQDDPKVILQTSLNNNKLRWSRLRRKGRNCQWSDYLPLGWSFCHLRQDYLEETKMQLDFAETTPLVDGWKSNPTLSNPSPELSQDRNPDSTVGILAHKPNSRAWGSRHSHLLFTFHNLTVN
jgi:hypothetical protein